MNGYQMREFWLGEHRGRDAEIERLKLWVQQADARGDDAMRRAHAAEAEVERLQALINSPHTAAWHGATDLEAAHQQERWGSDHDVGKAPADWFWLLGHLAGKAVAAFGRGDQEKGLHHIVSSSAALLNWHRCATGVVTGMRPGIDPIARGIEPAVESSEENTPEGGSSVFESTHPKACLSGAVASNRAEGKRSGASQPDSPHASPDGGPMGARQPAAAGPAEGPVDPADLHEFLTRHVFLASDLSCLLHQVAVWGIGAGLVTIDIPSARLSAEHLVSFLARGGLVLTVEQVPRRPLAMGNYDTVVSVRKVVGP